MDLTQLADLGEFIGGVGSAIGAIAVLATLIYLAVQVRQNTSAIRAGSAQAFADSVNGVNYIIAGSVDQARVWRLAMEDARSMTDDERVCADWMCLSACRTFDTGRIRLGGPPHGGSWVRHMIPHVDYCFPTPSPG